MIQEPRGNSNNNDGKTTTPLPSFILGTAGHIDHGKSTLVRKLTGTDPDRLAEEKRRGITIELGFAQLQLPSGNTCGVIDVPGHERFIRHMVEGATGVDVALLVVAADDGVMVQTREHLTILELLGVRNLVVAVTKSDAVDPDLVELALLDVAELLSTTTFDGADIIAVSAHTGDGLSKLLSAIEAAAARVSRSSHSDFVRLPIDRVFSIEGAGTIATGTLWDGIIQLEDQLISSSGKAVRVRDIQVHGTKRSKARSGQRVALNLAGIKREDIKRGELLHTPGKIRESSRFLALLHYSGNVPLKNGATVMMHHGTSETKARVKFLFSDKRVNEIAAGDNAYVQLRLDKSLPLHYEDRFVVRSLSPAFTIGGGAVLLADVGQHTKLSQDWFTLLGMLSKNETSNAAKHYLKLYSAPLNAEEVAARLGFNTSEVAQTLNQSELPRIRTERETFYLASETLSSLQKHTGAILLAFHEENPQSLDVSQGALHGLVFPHKTPQAESWTEVRFEAFLAAMAQNELINFDGGKVSHPKAASSVQALHEQVANQLLIDIEAQGLAVSSTAEHAERLSQPRDLIAQILGQLHRDGKLVRLASEYHFTPEHIKAAQDKLIAELKSRNEGMTAAEIRDLWQISRKYAIPLLEYCDAQGITYREGDLRHLKNSPQE
ncbi:MAG: selenocysteine-specific translation elongation factor [Coriobacteriia bacterium]|nr:selenocysteine-specific translation elongation factor [Coriobacteriia bacterium]MCL2746045.1 selenocysteine-specific translation elongation factor [Coriobacteriia bacterium]MCL2870898.1 selenocysteine-specific translation elongation factor [Coriobacteriia bacterium]